MGEPRHGDVGGSVPAGRVAREKKFWLLLGPGLEIQVHTVHAVTSNLVVLERLKIEVL